MKNSEIRELSTQELIERIETESANYHFSAGESFSDCQAPQDNRQNED